MKGHFSPAREMPFFYSQRRLSILGRDLCVLKKPKLKVKHNCCCSNFPNCDIQIHIYI